LLNILGSEILNRTPTERETNSVEFTNYYPTRNKHKVNDIFDFFISHDESVIYKKYNSSSTNFSKLLENIEIYSNFEKILNGDFFVSQMKHHICRGFELEADGSYKMEFLHGFRLDMLETYSLNRVIATQILEQCKILKDNLSEANAKNEFFGDWAMHNLVYCLSHKSILNVDLEGFITYRPIPEWADFSVVESWLNETMIQLQSIISGLE
jgi:hypothetical protein